MRPKAKYRVPGDLPPPVWDDYSARVEYRRVRRNLECAHHPWAWEGVLLSDSDEVEEGRCSPGRGRGDVRGGRDVRRADNDSGQDLQDLKRRAVEKALAVRRGHRGRSGQRSPSPLSSEDYWTEEDSDESLDRDRHRGRPARPMRKNGSPRNRESSACVADSKTSARYQPGDKLFLPFGMGDRHAEDLGVKRTFNVRSDKDVYPSAVRAQRRREQEISKRVDRAQSAPLRVKRHAALFNAASQYEHERRLRAPKTESYLSEYQRQYPGYDGAYYVTNRAKIASRLGPREVESVTPTPRMAK